MKYLKYMLLMINVVLVVVAQQWYELSSSRLTVSNCTRQQVDSLLTCAAIGRAAKAAKYLFNVDEFQCQWDCNILLNDSPTVKYQGWREYEIKWKKNSALGKPTIGSSVHEGNYGNWDPHYATDGQVQNGDIKIFHSSFEQFPWIRIDLFEILPISFIRVYNRRDFQDLLESLSPSFIPVYNRRDDFGRRFHHVAVEVTNTSDYVQRGFYKGPAATGEVVDILCDYPTVARYVRLRIIEGNGNSLNIPELEIYTT